MTLSFPKHDGGLHIVHQPRVDRRRWFWTPTERQAWRQYFDTLCWDEANGYAATAEERRLLMCMARQGNVFWRNEVSRPAQVSNSLLAMRYEDVSELRQQVSARQALQ